MQRTVLFSGVFLGTAVLTSAADSKYKAHVARFEQVLLAVPSEIRCCQTARIWPRMRNKGAGYIYQVCNAIRIWNKCIRPLYLSKRYAPDFQRIPQRVFVSSVTILPYRIKGIPM
jgi:hypothetical protein